jgi:hypothetical protein
MAEPDVATINDDDVGRDDDGDGPPVHIKPKGENQTQPTGISKKVGPLPVWGWAVVVFGGIIVFYVIKKRQANAAAQNATASGTIAGANGALSGFGSEGFSTNSAGQVIDNATGTVLGYTQGTGTSTTTTGAGWIAAAQQALFNLGYNNAQVDQALQQYSSGQALGTTNYGIIESAIALVGQPPSTLGVPQETSSANEPGLPASVAANYQQEVTSILGGTSGPGTPALAQAIQATPAAQRGSLENFFLLNEANQKAGYDYFTSNGLVTTTQGQAPGEVKTS